MRISRFFKTTTAALTGIWMLVAGCAERSPIAPNSETEVAVSISNEQYKLLGGILDPVIDAAYGLLTPTRAVTRTTELANDVAVSKTIGKSGGSIEIPSLGFRLDVPKGAVNGNVTFKVTAVAGRVVAYDFAPHGMVFLKPLTVTQDLEGTDWYSQGYRNSKGGYYLDRSLIDQVLGIVMTSELLSATVNKLSGTVKFQIEHFSGYMVSGC